MLMPVELAKNDMFAVNCPADGMTMLVTVSVDALVDA